MISGPVEVVSLSTPAPAGHSCRCYERIAAARVADGTMKNGLIFSAFGRVLVKFWSDSCQVLLQLLLASRARKKTEPGDKQSQQTSKAKRQAEPRNLQSQKTSEVKG